MKINNIFFYILIISFTLSACSTSEEEVPGDTTSSTIWTGSNKTFLIYFNVKHGFSTNIRFQIHISRLGIKLREFNDNTSKKSTKIFLTKSVAN